ncbi:MAG: hypothetical protein IJA60_07080 [Clostridia bacterium]|nr:hypothetical protein [Clostridia bacterium]
MKKLDCFEKYLAKHLERYPEMQPQDVVKICYQAAYGAEHLLGDVNAAKEYFISEYSAVEPQNTEIFEEISQEYIRVNLAAWKYHGLPQEWLFNMFAFTAKNRHDADNRFDEYLQIAEKSIGKEYIEGYKKGGARAVHHSDEYRAAYKPAYRVVCSRFVRLIPVLVKAAKLPEKDGARVISIDGRAASGKTTAAKMLSKVLGAAVLHMDDFFLPPEMRSCDRFAQPGGNVHYERFAKEVLPALSECESFSYSIFDCGIMDFAGSRVVENLPWRIVEGAYSCHKAFGDYADLKVFFDIDAEEQMRRIIARNGEEMAEMFRTRWIPLEEEYYIAHNIKEKADIIVK